MDGIARQLLVSEGATAWVSFHVHYKLLQQPYQAWVPLPGLLLFAFVLCKEISFSSMPFLLGP
jgi:hypothetical protein